MAISQEPNLLITGGTGFIGSHLAKYAIQNGWSVTSISINKPRKKNYINGVNYLKCDLRKEKNLEKIFKKKFNFIVNLSGYINHINFSVGGNKVILEHFDILRNIVTFVDKRYLQCLVNIGSSDEYGNLNFPQKEYFREMPHSPYSFGKTASSHFLEMLYRSEGFPSCTLRLFLVYGPGQNKNRFLPQIITGCLNDTKFPTSKGMQLRDFCYIDDIVSGIFKVLQSKNVFGKTYNLASGQPIKIKTIVKMIVSKLKKGKPEFGELDYRPGENMNLVADIKKIEKDINWKPKVSIENGIDKTIQWYINN